MVLLPVLFFTLYEVLTLNSNEKLIESIYESQLQSVIYSVNQYSQDYVTNWSSSINSIIYNSKNDEEKMREQMGKFILENPSVIRIFLCDSSLYNNVVFENRGSVFTIGKDNEEIKRLLQNNRMKIKRLFGYQKSGYNKIETLNEKGDDSCSVLIFISSEEFGQKNIVGIVINPSGFIESVLAPKIQEISRDDIIITCYKTEDNSIIYSNISIGLEDFQWTGALWLLQGYNLAISLKGRTIEGLVKQRSVTNLIMIFIVAIILVLGVLLVYRSTKREIEFAQLKSDFVSNVSHELRTPLALISMFAETLEMNRITSEKKRQDYYRIISQETARLNRIVNTILNFSKMEAGKREYRFESVDLNDIVSGVMGTYSFHLKNKGFTSSIGLYDGKLSIEADREALSEAFINLLDNAVKYSADKKEISIRTGVSSGNVFLSVKDSGIGISENDRHKIFDKFFRVTNGLVHNTKGTGMGLSIVKHIVEAHHGRIKLESELNTGSIFTIELPLKVISNEDEVENV
ncbi:MAG: HAMP domain-containing histidine kinase [Melioribacteraceae bacterium]|nr:HAMP domain-containing histidine kinase [Melioribacteraceae bacterium]